MNRYRYISLFLTFYFLFFTITTPVFSQSPTGGFRSTPQKQLVKILTRNYIPLTSNITLMTDNKRDDTLIIKDYLNSTRILIDGTGKTINTISYYPYGNMISPLNPNSQSLNSKYFTNHRKLDSLSVYHAGARFYSPTLGTFIQPDSVEGPNRYGYVANNPVMFNDPSGNSICDQDPALAPLWNILGQCGGNNHGENFMGEEGLNSVGELTAAAESASVIGGVVAWIGDKFKGNSTGSDTINSAYSSLSGGALLTIIALGLTSPDSGDIDRLFRGRETGFFVRELKNRGVRFRFMDPGELKRSVYEAKRAHGVNKQFAAMASALRKEISFNPNVSADIGLLAHEARHLDQQNYLGPRVYDTLLTQLREVDANVSAANKLETILQSGRYRQGMSEHQYYLRQLQRAQRDIQRGQTLATNTLNGLLQQGHSLSAIGRSISTSEHRYLAIIGVRPQVIVENGIRKIIWAQRQ